MPYKVDYTVMKVKTLISTSEGLHSPFNGSHGHASSRHDAITDTGLTQRLNKLSAASAFKNQQLTGLGTNAKAHYKTLDQSFLVTEVLNSDLGQAALAAFDTALAGTHSGRLLICSIGKASQFALREAKLDLSSGISKTQAKKNPSTYGVVSDVQMEQVIVIVDGGFDSAKNEAPLHILTAYPGSGTDAVTYGADGGYEISVAGGGTSVTRYTA